MTSLKIAEGDIPQLEGTVAIISGGRFLAKLIDGQILTLVGRRFEWNWPRYSKTVGNKGRHSLQS